ncbi:hypothetical protein GU926_13200 [Nibribacter ruber]|uniref:Uncharacterized protein n=1 Tax=Nibribacter ruber TaxID=2698458 RepID=A0A6P1NXD1_9BACT|nr:hypothetical protein [Nibribacter ruber]QHL88337.1 hypothetical protein GU926_13200 [Nibribacter ruber]
MENRTNQAGQQSSASSQNTPQAGTQNTASSQSRSQNATASSSQQQPSYTSQSQSQQSPRAQQQNQSSNRNQQPQDRQGQQSSGILGGLTSSLSNIQMPQAVKDFGATCARSYNGLSTTQKVVGGAALALGASYWAAKSSGWVGQGKGANKNRNKSGR